jgi:hypothetical protein
MRHNNASTRRKVKIERRGRPSLSGSAEPKMKQVTICLPEDVLDQGKRQAREEDRAFSNYLCFLIRQKARESAQATEPSPELAKG